MASGPAAQSEHVNAPLARLEFTSRLDGLDTADFVIEAVNFNIFFMFAANGQPSSS